MEKAIQEGIEEVVHELNYPKAFSCYTSGLKNLSQVRDVGLESFVACLTANLWECSPSRHSGLSGMTPIERPEEPKNLIVSSLFLHTAYVTL